MNSRAEVLERYRTQKLYKCFVSEKVAEKILHQLIEQVQYSSLTSADYSKVCQAIVRDRKNDKDTIIQLLKDIAEKLHFTTPPYFPPIHISNQFERILFIAKYLQTSEHTRMELPDLLWVSEKTINNDIKKLRGEDSAPICISGNKFVVPETRARKGRILFESTVHPIFLTLNVSQVIALLEGLYSSGKKTHLQNYATSTAVNIWKQLSDYGKGRVRLYYQDFAPSPEILKWLDELENPLLSVSQFMTERECHQSGSHEVLMYSWKSSNEVYLRFMLGGKEKYLKKVVAIQRDLENKKWEIRTEEGIYTINDEDIVKCAYDATSLFE